MNSSDTSSSATSQYHAQLYSGQKQLQKRHQQQQQQQSLSQHLHYQHNSNTANTTATASSTHANALSLHTLNCNKPTHLNYKVISFDPPNLYHTSLKLTSEIDIHAWWSSLVKIFSGNSFHATRIALSIPQDPNDPYNGPWGLKAVYNKTGSISQDTDQNNRKNNSYTVQTDDDDYFLHSHTVHETTAPRHIPWCFERLQPFESEPEPLINNPSISRILKRNAPVVLSREYRRKSSTSSTKKPSNEDYSFELFKRALMERNDKNRKSSWSLPIITTPCLSKDETSEILVDGTLLSETNLDDLVENATLAEAAASNNIGSKHNAPISTFIPDYDEYEQQQPSPWSQSPAPSPAIMDAEINPFFQSPPDIDDDAFNPASPENYDNTSVPFPPPISNVHSVVHVPLFHPSDVIDAHNQHQLNHHPYFPNYSMPTHYPNTISHGVDGAHTTKRNGHSSNPTPIAILSFLAPVVPYPPILLNSINSLSPFIATSFTNANQNSQFRKQGQPLRTSSSSGKGVSNDKYTEQHISSSVGNPVDQGNSKRPKARRNKSSSKSQTIVQQYMNRQSKSDAEDDDEDKFERDFGSTTTTPIAAFPSQHLERPNHLNFMSNFTRSSLDTVHTDVQSPLFSQQPFGAVPHQLNTAKEEQQQEAAQAVVEEKTCGTATSSVAGNSPDEESMHSEFSSLSSLSDQSTFSAPAESLHQINNLLLDSDDVQADDHQSNSETNSNDIMLPNFHHYPYQKQQQHRKGSSSHISSTTTTNTNNANNSVLLERRQSTGSISRTSSFKALSPSSIAVMEGWDAVSPTTGLPISASIPPHDMCSDTNCCCDDGHSTQFGVEKGDERAIMKDADPFLETDMDDNFAADVDDNDEDDCDNSCVDDGSLSARKRVVGTEDENAGFDEHTSDLLLCQRMIAEGDRLFTHSTSNNKRQQSVYNRSRRRSKKKRKYSYKHFKRQQQYDDDGFHYHHNHSEAGHARSSSDPFLVVPRSSLLRLIIDGIPIHVFTYSARTRQVTWVNNRTLQYTGRSLNEHLGPKWLSHMHPDDQPECKKAWEQAYEQGNGFAGEYRLRRFDGVYRCFLWRIVPLRDVRGRIIHWFGTCTDIHDQHLAKENNLRQVEIESNERKYRLLAEAIPQIVFAFSPSVGLTYANGNWSEYSGKSFLETMGLGFMSCVHPEDRAKLHLPDLPGIPNKAGISWQDEIRLLSVNEEYKWFLVKCVSVDELETDDVRWFGTWYVVFALEIVTVVTAKTILLIKLALPSSNVLSTDINDHKLLEQKLKEAHDAAQKSTESKTRFLSNMSHEIRTPLIGITGMLNFLLDTELTAEQIDYVHTIQQSAESLLVVINDILDLSKVEAGMMKLEWEPFSLVTMIEDANELLSTLAIQKNLELSFWVEDSVPDVVVGDRVRLRQVLLNLIGNAIKFTSEGEVFTNCVVQNFDREESELTLLFEVIDTGTGFNKMEEAVMFKPFSQVDSSSTRKHGGSGLGLVISRQLIELHGGTMKCHSQKGKGSTFYFTVKFSVPTSHTQPLPQTPRDEKKSDPFFRSNGYENNNNTAQSDTEKNEYRNLSPMPFVSRNSNAVDIQPFSTSMINDIPAATTANGNAIIPTDMLQDVLLTKAATMQLKPPPIRNTSTTTTAAHATVTVAKNPTVSTCDTAVSITATEETEKEALNRRPSVRVDDIVALPSTTNNVSTVLSTATPTNPNFLPSDDNTANNKSNSNELRIPTFNNGSTAKTSSSTASSIGNTDLLPPRTPTISSPLRALIVSEWKWSRECIENSVKSILNNIVSLPSKEEVGRETDDATASYYWVDTITNHIEAIERLTDPNTPPYDYILINLPSEQHILLITKTICASLQQRNASVLVVTTPIQRSLITEGAKGQEDQFFPKTCGFVFKPLKRAKLRWYFGIRDRNNITNTASPSSNNEDKPSVVNNVSVATPDTPYKRATTQKEIFKRMAADVGGKGYRVLLVEDNLVNQKVLTRYLSRVGLNVDVAAHGGECLELFHKHPKDYYCLILCDLFMPVKDGYETTREIRGWEKENLGPDEKPKPIIALSANVMSDVANKCFDCGFSTYISKPVNFAVLSDVIRNFLLNNEQ